MSINKYFSLNVYTVRSFNASIARNNEYLFNRYMKSGLDKSQFPQKVDVLVVGAGPAGISAANRLNRGGASVLLIDARKHIGYPLRCGELTNGDIFYTMGFRQKQGWLRRKLRYESENMVVLNRPKMENDMAGILSERGVIVRESTSLINVEDYSDNGRIAVLVKEGEKQRVYARLIIASDGVSSRAARYAGIDTRLSLDQFASCIAYRMINAKIEYPFRFYYERLNEVKPYYFWVIPSGRNEANVGIGVKAIRGHAAKPILDRLIKSSGAIEDGMVKEVIIGAFPSTLPLEKPYADGLLVAGTAARLISADMGDGIEQAALSGSLAARVYLELNNGKTSQGNLSVYRHYLNSMYEDLYKSYENRNALGKN